MKDFFFWTKWPKSNKLIYLGALSLALIAILFFSIAGFRGLENAIDWNTEKNLTPYSLKIDEFTKGPINYKVEVESYVISESFKASEVKISQLPSFVFLLLTFLSTSLLLAILTFLSRSWYIIGMAVFILFIVLLKLELLAVFGFGQEFTIAVLILVCGLGYYFHAFRESTSFTVRLFTFISAFAAIAMAIAFGSKVDAPFLYLANFGIVGPIILSLFFIIIVGYEIVSALLFISTAGRNFEKKNRLLNFTIITFLYLANLILLLLKKKNYIDWDILYLNMFFLLAVSFVIGIWGYKKRSITFRDILPFSPYGALFYLSFAIIAFSTIAYSFSTGNDPLTECFEYAILYSHICLGFIFFCYVGFNFMHLFNKNLSIYDVVYQPMRMPLFMVRGVGCAAMLALFLYSNSFPFYLGLAGYYNGCGDVYLYTDDLLMAKQYYRSGVQFEFQNHRSNYSLATIADQENNKEVSQEYYTGTLFKNPSEYSIINLSNFYLTEKMFFPSLFTLRDGLKTFPKSGPILNNLGLLYSKTRVKDSSFYYLEKAFQQGNNEEIAAANLLYNYIQLKRFKEADSLASETKSSQIAFANNATLVNTILGKEYSPKAVENIDKLDAANFSLIFNNGINKLKGSDTSLFKSLYELNKDSSNSTFSDGIRFLEGLKRYYSGNILSGIHLVQSVKNTALTSSYYAKILALWMMESNAFDLAGDYFKETFADGGQQAVMNYCIAKCEAGRFDDALPHLQNLSQSHSPELASIASNILAVIQPNAFSQFSTYSDNLKYQYIYFNDLTLKSNEASQLINQINDPYQKLQSIAVLMKLLNNEKKYSKADSLYKNLNFDLSAPNSAVGEINYQYLISLAGLNEWKVLADNYKSLSLNKDRERARAYFNATALAGIGQKEKAQSIYLSALQKDPLNEELLLSASTFFNTSRKEQKAYEVLQQGIQLNPYSIVLHKAYALQCLRLNLETYGDDTMNRLFQLMSQSEFKTFEKEYLVAKQGIE